ncbi:MAG: hypothetical protein ACK4RK_01380 [Gemmataceae bacterium]
MNRFLSLLLVFIVCAGVCPAHTVPPDLQAPLRSFQKNRLLLQELVATSLRLADEDDPLKRAEHCQEMAERLAQEIQKAASDQEGARVNELGLHFRNVLRQGVAANITAAGNRIPVGSERERELEQLGQRVLRMALPLEEQLQATQPLTTHQTLRAIHAGREEVERALRHRNIPVGP